MIHLWADFHWQSTVTFSTCAMQVTTRSAIGVKRRLQCLIPPTMQPHRCFCTDKLVAACLDESGDWKLQQQPGQHAGLAAAWVSKQASFAKAPPPTLGKRDPAELSDFVRALTAAVRDKSYVLQRPVVTCRALLCTTSARMLILQVPYGIRVYVNIRQPVRSASASFCLPRTPAALIAALPSHVSVQLAMPLVAESAGIGMYIQLSRLYKDIDAPAEMDALLAGMCGQCH